MEITTIPKSLTKNVEVVAYNDLGGRGSGFKMSIKEHEGKMYMYVGHIFARGWDILDITDPYHPQNVGFLEGPDNTFSLQVTQADDLMLLALEEAGAGQKHRAHLWGFDLDKPNEEGVLLYDISDPVHPKYLSHFHTGGGGTHRNAYYGGKYAYLAANMKGYKGNILVILDVSDPRNPQEVSRWWYPGQWLDGNEAEQYPASPFTAYFHGPAYPVGPDPQNPEKLYLPYGRAGVIVLDVTDIRHPRKIGHMNIGDFGSIIGLHTVMPLPERNIAITTMESIWEDDRDPLNLVTVLDISKDNPKPIAVFPLPIPPKELGIADFYEKGGKFGPHNVHLPMFNKSHAEFGNIVPVTYESAGVWFYDITHPGVPQICGYFIPEDPTVRRGPLPRELATQSEDLVIDNRGFIYVTDKNYGIFVLKYKPEDN